MIPAILVGRKGSKGFPGKNTYEVMGKPLCYYPSKIASQVELIDEIYFSTDCPKMKDFAHKENYKISHDVSLNVGASYVYNTTRSKH